MSRNNRFHIATKCFKNYDSSNGVLNDNQVLYNNPTSVVETNSNEK